MNVIRITVAIEPVAKGRPCTTFTRGKIWTFTPERTRIFEDFLKARFMRHKDKMFPAGTPVKMTVIYYRTKSKYLKKSETRPFRKPDLNNFVGATLDAMNGILVADDAQVTDLHATKRWSTKSYGYLTLKLEEDKG